LEVFPVLLRREGWPEEDELVVCTVTGIQPHCVFARLDEYDKSGLIHISEIAPGRVRNIREHVGEGKKIVCKILRIDKERGHIDLSLRRVNEGQKRAKLNSMKQETLAEKIVEHVAHKQKLKVEDLYNAVTDKVFEKYPLLFDCFREVADSKVNLVDLGVEKGIADELTAQIKDRLVAVEVSLKGTLTIHTTAPNGVELIREALGLAQKTDKTLDIRYLGNGMHMMSATGADFKSVEKILRTAADAAIEFGKKNKMTIEFARQE
jgi:translation initiation factor 2 subunit 1